MRSFIFGNIDNCNDSKGLEHILLEAKKFIFYNIKDPNRPNNQVLFLSFKKKIKNMIVIKQKIAIRKNKVEQFGKKWEFCTHLFLNILDFDLDDV